MFQPCSTHKEQAIATKKEIHGHQLCPNTGLQLQPQSSSLIPQEISLKIKRHQIKVTLELPFSISKLMLHSIICKAACLSFERDSQGICSPKGDRVFVPQKVTVGFTFVPWQRARHNKTQVKCRTVLQP